MNTNTIKLNDKSTQSPKFDFAHYKDDIANVEARFGLADLSHSTATKEEIERARYNRFCIIAVLDIIHTEYLETIPDCYQIQALTLLFRNFKRKFTKWVNKKIQSPKVWNLYGRDDSPSTYHEEIGFIIDEMIARLDHDNFFSRREVELGLMALDIINTETTMFTYMFDINEDDEDSEN